MSVYRATELGKASYFTNATGCVNIGTIEIVVVTGTRRVGWNLRTFLRRTAPEELSRFDIRFVPRSGWTAVAPPPLPLATPGLVGGHKDTRAALACMTRQRSGSILDDPDVAGARIRFSERSGPRGASVHAQTRRLMDPAVPISRQMNSPSNWTWPTYDATLRTRIGATASIWPRC